jgi:hypothetical protein
MVETMTPSQDITTGQICKFQELLGSALRKSGLPSGPVQQVLETTGGELVTCLVTALRTAVEAIGAMFSRRVTVDQTRSAQAALDATGRTQYTNAKIVAVMPRPQSSEEEVFFFRLGRYVTDDELANEYALRGLKATSPYSLAAVNEADPAFADEHPNATHFKDAKGNWCFATFDRWDDKRDLHVGRDARAWSDDWWFAGVRK